ncbi:MAG: HAD hydrolase-like protein, partial [Desulfovibrio sp.]|nr:HAD hydrolase-like protein [Desulfovibrio sp.]
MKFPRIAPEIFPQGLAGVVFDCDGVMIDSREANRAFYNGVLAVMDLPAMGPEEESYAFMATAMEALRRMVPEARHGEIMDAVNRVDYGRTVLPLIRLMPGFRPFIEALHAAGCRLAIDTNRTDVGIERVLDFFSLPPYFEPVISASCARPKPSPAGPERLLRAGGAAPGPALVVGGSANARAA